MNHSDKIAADKTSLGFEFQDLVYVEKLIELKEGQSLGLEVHDDIHIEMVDKSGLIDNLTLVQVKHSVNSGNITDRDIDLWKTIYNWINLLPSLPKINNITFQLFTNKALNSQHFISLLKSKSKDLESILSHIRITNTDILEAESKKEQGDPPNPLAKFVSCVSETNDEKLNFIFERFEFHSDDSSIIERISSSLRHFSVPEEQIPDTRKYVIGAFKESKYSTIKENNKVIISYDDFRTRIGFNRIIRSARAEEIDFDQFVNIYYSHDRPDKLSFLDSVFFSQLKDIEIDDEEIIDRGVEMILAEKFMASLREKGTFTAHDDSKLEKKSISEWNNLHRRLHRNSDSENDNESSVQCYDATMDNKLTVEGTELPINLSCGKFIKLSNSPLIGWRKDWRGKFKK
ncbi:MULTISPECIES: hypothetical protein [unclassified Enterobacter]|jgi:hypothetical protein|uniref:hypothetical protein n=1 Tax=unclassified Enterobacter TaxID=2608935 RepID=UPI0015CA52E4|nr:MULTISPECIES: hypothetical protein [unclassified Enterobacter]MBB3303929.1 hypothetical protein [Enterobacter sp. Sphag1F]NYI12966.1 hypothetical protein [Enterobacter sp. Sphag71]